MAKNIDIETYIHHVLISQELRGRKPPNSLQQAAWEEIASLIVLLQVKVTQYFDQNQLKNIPLDEQPEPPGDIQQWISDLQQLALVAAAKSEGIAERAALEAANIRNYNQDDLEQETFFLLANAYLTVSPSRQGMYTAVSISRAA